MNHLKIGILAPDYPNEKKMPFAFIHSRAKLYLEQGVSVYVFVVSKHEHHEIYEGVEIFRSNKKKLREKIKDINPDVLAVHFPNILLAPFAQSLDYPKVAWIHGHEILWKPYISATPNLLINLKKWVLLIPFNIIQIYRTRRFLNHVEYVVFVSKWMKETAELHSLKRYANAKIIPNPVDTESFKFAAIEKRDRKRGISLRGFSNTKYGLDIAIKAFSKQDQVKLDIVGKGIYRDKFISLSKRLNANVEIIEKVIPHSKIAEYYRPYGFFVAPSRIEAQGVAMCEAMACGLPVISTNVGGIPEFIRDGKDGYLVPKNDSEQLMQAVNKLMALSKEEYNEMSNNARENVLNTCSSSIITRMELDILTKAVTDYKQRLV